MGNDDLLREWGPVVAIGYAIVHLWVRYFSARVTLKTDFQLYKTAKEIGIDTKIMEEGIQRRIRSIYTPEVESEQVGQEAASIPGNLVLALICCALMYVGVEAVTDGIMGKSESSIGAILFWIPVSGFFAYGMFVTLRDAAKLVGIKIRAGRVTGNEANVPSPKTSEDLTIDGTKSPSPAPISP